MLGLITRRDKYKIREHDSNFTEHLLLPLLCGVTGQAITMQPGKKKITAELDYDKTIGWKEYTLMVLFTAKTRCQ